MYSNNNKKQHHCGTSTDHLNDQLIIDLVKAVNPKLNVKFPDTIYSPWDAMMIDEQGTTKGYIESKIRHIESVSFDSMLLDAVKAPLIELSKEAPVFIVQQYHDYTYLAKLAEGGTLSPQVEISQRNCNAQTHFRNTNKVPKKVYLIKFKYCWKYSYENRKIIRINNPQKAA